MADNQYLSIGEVLGLLLEDFPDVTISKIRFLESQGLIEPERTPSGYRKFYDHDVDLLRAILHEQKANFLPLKVIRDRIESGAIDAETGSARTPPRGIRNVEPRPVPVDPRDSVFRRTDGGPEWADGRALIPGDPEALHGEQPSESSAPVTTSVPVIPAGPPASAPHPATRVAAPVAGAAPRTGAGGSPAAGVSPMPATAPSPQVGSSSPAASSVDGHVSATERHAVHAPSTVAPASPAPSVRPAPAGAGAVAAATAPSPAAGSSSPVAALIESPRPVKEPAATTKRAVKTAPMRDDDGSLPYTRDELCAAAGVSAADLHQLEEFGVVTPRGSGASATFQPEALEIVRVAAQFLAQGIDARHLRAWRQAAERESALFEQRIMPLLRQRNPQSRRQALDTLGDLVELGGQLHNALMASMLRHHFDGT